MLLKCCLLSYYLIATVFQVDCPEEIDRYGMAWPGALFGEVIGLNCSENGNITG